ncbi:MAG: zinc ribbon domain-containing protein [Oscillospiraceae bacterium]|jgi:uncharacterized Zn finger protein (UPF0148 family)|nr:zinc ribbon domain-containing protein [Oscillospiraceae bacterium]
MFCPECGFNAKGRKFCSGCGYNLFEEQESAQKEQVSAQKEQMSAQKEQVQELQEVQQEFSSRQIKVFGMKYWYIIDGNAITITVNKTGKEFYKGEIDSIQVLSFKKNKLSAGEFHFTGEGIKTTGDIFEKQNEVGFFELIECLTAVNPCLNLSFTQAMNYDSNKEKYKINNLDGKQAEQGSSKVEKKRSSKIKTGCLSVVVILFVLIIIIEIIPDNTEETPIGTGISQENNGEQVSTGIIIDFDTNLLFNKYDIRILVNGFPLDIQTQGEKVLYEFALSEGLHTLTLSEIGNDKNTITETFEVLANNYYFFFIKAGWSGIEIERKDTMTLDEAQLFVGDLSQVEANTEPSNVIDNNRFNDSDYIRHPGKIEEKHNSPQTLYLSTL